MARLTYAALALALAALVAGFFVRTTALPLFVSIGLSALVLILILRGWARRVRRAEAGEGAEALEEVEELEDIDFAPPDLEVVDVSEVAEPVPVRQRKVPERRPREPRERPAPRPRPRAARAPTIGASMRVVVLPGRTRYHRPQCRFARGRGAKEISVSTARRQNYQPCTVCLGG